ncbi:MAG: M15 family metallopeptidase [Rubrobacteraceae bacterium]
MFRRPQFFSGKNTHVLPWTVAFIGLLCLSVLASGLNIVESGNGGTVGTVTQPRTEAIESPNSDDVVGGAELEDSLQEVAQNADCEDLLLMVGPDHILKSGYVPPDLGYLSYYGITARGAEDMLREEAAVQLGSLVSDAAQDGVEVLVASGYRSYWEQNGTFEWFKDEYGEDAGKLSVPPGQSEHQLGTAVDFASSDTNYELVPEFAQTRAGVWLKGHAAQYGFILSYGKDREADTGVIYEPWHYRYIGVEKALQVEAAEGDTTSFYREGTSLCYGP